MKNIELTSVFMPVSRWVSYRRAAEMSLTNSSSKVDS